MTTNTSNTIIEVIDASLHSIVGDGVTVNTESFRSLLDSENRTIRIPAGDYVTGSLTILANTVLILEPGTLIRDSGELTDNTRLINIVEDNVHVIGHGARIVANRADYTTGEQRHGVLIWGAQHIRIEGLGSSGHGVMAFTLAAPLAIHPPT